MSLTIRFPDSSQQDFIADNVTIGHAESMINLSSDHAVIPRHAEFFYDMSNWWIRRLSTDTNIQVGNVQVMDVLPLKPGATITIGSTTLSLNFTSLNDAIQADEGIVEFEYELQEHHPAESLAESERLALLTQIELMARHSQGQRLLENIVAALLKMYSKMEHATIILLQDKELIPVAFYPLDQSYVSFTLARRAITTRKAFLWERAIASAASGKIPSLRDTISALYAPIIHNRRVLGVIQLDTTAMDITYEKQDVDRLSELATNLGHHIYSSAKHSLSTIPSIFVSYAHDDIEFVKQMTNDLRRKPVSVWFDERLRAGRDWEEQLGTAIEAVDAFVLVLSPSSVKSEYVRWEIEHAQQYQKTIFPVLFKDCELPDDLRRIQYIKMLDGNYESGVAELINDLFELRNSS